MLIRRITLPVLLCLIVIAFGESAGAQIFMGSTGDNLENWPPEDMRIRQQLKELLNGEKDLEYRVIFEDYAPLHPPKDSPILLRNDVPERYSDSSHKQESITVPISIPRSNSEKKIDGRLKLRELYGPRLPNAWVPISIYVCKSLEPSALLLEDGDYKNALANLERISLQNSLEQEQSDYLRALALHGLGKVDESKQLYENVIEKSSDAQIKLRAKLGLRRIEQKIIMVNALQLKFLSKSELPPIK